MKVEETAVAKILEALQAGPRTFHELERETAITRQTIYTALSRAQLRRQVVKRPATWRLRDRA